MKIIEPLKINIQNQVGIFDRIFRPWIYNAKLEKRIKSLQMADSELAKNARAILEENELLKTSVELQKDVGLLYLAQTENENLTRENILLADKLKRLQVSYDELYAVVMNKIENS